MLTLSASALQIGLIACIRLDEVNYAKLQKEMKSEYEAVEAVSQAKTAAR